VQEHLQRENFLEGAFKKIWYIHRKYDTTIHGYSYIHLQVHSSTTKTSISLIHFNIYNI
jgi:hypothetical protein